MSAGKQVEETHKFGQKLMLKLAPVDLTLLTIKQKFEGGKKAGGKRKPKLPNFSATQNGLNVCYSISVREKIFRYAHIH